MCNAYYYIYRTSVEYNCIENQTSRNMLKLNSTRNGKHCRKSTVRTLVNSFSDFSLFLIFFFSPKVSEMRIITDINICGVQGVFSYMQSINLQSYVYTYTLDRRSKSTAVVVATCYIILYRAWLVHPSNSSNPIG